MLRIKVPTRGIDAPETTLSVQIKYGKKEDLQTKPFVFILPGGPGANHSHYRDYEYIQKVANLIYYDPRGCGLSDKGEQTTYNMNNYIDDVHYIIKNELKLEQVILLGKSY